MFFFISGAEIVFVFFIVLLVFGADRIPGIAKALAKGITQIRHATNEIKNEIQNSVDLEDTTSSIQNQIKKEVDPLKKDFEKLTDSVKRNS